MVDILFYWFRFAEASRKSHMVQMNKYLISKKPSHSLHVVAVTSHPKRQAWTRESLSTALIHSKSCPSVPRKMPGSSRGSLGLHCCACPLDLAFSLTAIYQNLPSNQSRFPSSITTTWKNRDLFQSKPQEVNDLRCVTAD